MSLTSLPAELLDAICEPLASTVASLASLALTCVSANRSATRLLYRNLAISTYARNLPVVHTLATHPHLARHVRSLAVTISDVDIVLRAFYVQLHAALRHMPLLGSLKLLVDADAAWVLSGLKDPSTLEHFVCSFTLDAHVAAFLGRTPALRSLQLSDLAIPDAEMLPTSHIPLLESYTGPASLLPLLASRPLTTIHLSGDLKIKDIPLPLAAPTTRTTQSDVYSYLPPNNSDFSESQNRVPVQIFSAVTSAPPVLLLETLALAYPGLVCLKLMTTYAFWEAPDMTLYTRIASTLSSLKSLNVFELSGMHWEPRIKPSGAVPHKHDEGEKEWISPPVTPRGAETNAHGELSLENQSQDFGFGEAFFDWSY